MDILKLPRYKGHVGIVYSNRLRSFKNISRVNLIRWKVRSPARRKEELMLPFPILSVTCPGDLLESSIRRMKFSLMSLRSSICLYE
mgnify:CR=1 FL=1